MSKPRVAVFGLNGVIGKSFLTAIESPVFSDKFELPVIAVTRNLSTQTSNRYIKYVQGDIGSDATDLISEIEGVDVVVSLLGDQANKAPIERLLEKVKPKVYIPSQFGTDIAEADKYLPGFLSFKTAHSDHVRALGLKVVDIVTSLIAGGFWLYESVASVGADPETKTVTYLGSPEQKLTYSAVDDIGRVIASVAYRAYTSPSEFPDKVRVSSGVIAVRDVVAQYEKRHEVKLDVKAVVSKEQALEDGKSIWREGFNPEKFFYYLNFLVSQGEGAGLCLIKNDNELVNPNQSLWKWTAF